MAKRIKELTVDELAESFREARNLLVVGFQGTAAEDMNDLRGDLRKSSVRFLVVKNSLAARAFDRAGKEPLANFLSGASAVVMGGDDVVSLAKAVNEVAKKHKALQVYGGFAQGSLLSKEEVATLAAIPPRQVLYAQIVGAISGPLRGFTAVAQSLLVKLIIVFKAVAEGKPGTEKT